MGLHYSIRSTITVYTIINIFASNGYGPCTFLTVDQTIRIFLSRSSFLIDRLLRARLESIYFFGSHYSTEFVHWFGLANRSRRDAGESESLARTPAIRLA
eukprot:81664-Hanusia_phi.AAC.1